MTPSDLIDIAKRRYNATGDDFFPEAEMLDLIWAAERILATEALMIEKSTTDATVVGQRAYDFPTNAISIKRIEYDGKKLMPISFRMDDSLTLNDATTTDQGEPGYYVPWGKKYYLRPLPSAVNTLTIYSYNMPAEVLIADTNLEIPSEFQMRVVDYLLMEMATKDNNPAIADRYEARWLQTIRDARRWMRKSRRGDGPATVMDVETMPNTILGIA